MIHSNNKPASDHETHTDQRELFYKNANESIAAFWGIVAAVPFVLLLIYCWPVLVGLACLWLLCVAISKVISEIAAFFKSLNVFDWIMLSAPIILIMAIIIL